MPKSSRSYLLTVAADVDDNGYSKEEVESRLQCYTYVGQLEEGEKENEITEKHFLHWQIYIENNTPIKFDTLRSKFDKKPIHIEKRKGTKKQAYDYCTKDDETYKGVRIGNGEIELEDNKGKRTDLDNIADDILAGSTEDDIYIKYPSSAHCMSYDGMYNARTYSEAEYQAALSAGASTAAPVLTGSASNLSWTTTTGADYYNVMYSVDGESSQSVYNASTNTSVAMSALSLPETKNFVTFVVAGYKTDGTLVKSSNSVTLIYGSFVSDGNGDTYDDTSYAAGYNTGNTAGTASGQV